MFKISIQNVDENGRVCVWNTYLSEIEKCKHVDFTLFFVVSNFAKLNFKKTIQAVDKYFNKSKNYIVSNQTLNEDFIKENNVNLLQSVDDFLDLL